MKTVHHIKYYLLALLILVVASGTLLYSNFLGKERRYFVKESEMLRIAYNAILNTHAQTVRAVHQEMCEQPELIEILRKATTATQAQRSVLRNALFQKLLPTYRHLKKQGITAVQLHLPDGTSFLRMHDPSRFSDPLSGKRYSVRLVNSLQVPIRGVEVGTLDLGYCHLFPLFSELDYVGSLELGISMANIREQLEALFLREFVFISQKDLLASHAFQSQYTPSLLSDDYWRDTQDVFVHEGEDTLLTLNAQIKPRIAPELKKGAPFVARTQSDGSDFLVAFLPIEDIERNQVAYLVSYVRDAVIRGYWKTFSLQLTGTSVVALLLVVAVYAIIRSRHLIAQSKDQLQRITDNMSEGLCVLDREKRVTFVNPAAERILKYARAELLEQDLHASLHHHDKDGSEINAGSCQIYQAIDAGKVYTSENQFFITKEQSYVPIEVTTAPIFEEGTLLGSVVVFRDITQRKKVEEQLQQMNRQLAEASQHKTDFLASMSHELRTPLNAMIGYTSLTLNALKETLPPRHLKNLIKAEQSSRLLLQLINDILDFSKIEAGRMETCIEEVDLLDLLDDVMITAEGLVLEKPLELQSLYPEALPPIKSDYTKLKQILHNLLSNAIKFTEEGHVALRAMPQSSGSCLRIEVEDTGCGIPASKIESIFESFKQVDGSISKKFGGTGLGLAISKKLCQMLGIEIGVHSEVEKGTTFWLQIPLYADEEDSPAHDTEQLAEHVRADEQGAGDPPFWAETELQANVLCFGSQETRILISRHLAGFPLQVQAVTSVADCLEFAKTLPIWAMLLEPGGDGFETLSQLKAESALAQIPVIMCLTSDELLHFHLESLDHLTKPVEQKGLLEALMRVTKIQRGEVLIVDDDPTIRELYRQYLAQSGYLPHVVANGVEVLEYLQTHASPQAIILDLLMPEMDGFQVLERLHAEPRWKQIPVIIVTGKHLSNAEKDHLHHGSQLLLEKGPSSAKELPTHIEHVVRSVTNAGVRSLLVIDDNQMNLQLIEGIFQEEGYYVYTALSGREGIEIAREVVPDTILMDLAMPELDGFETTTILKQDPRTRDITIIACSALSTQSSQESAFQAGCEGYITKPIEPERLVKQVTRCVLTSKIRRKFATRAL